MFRLHAEKERKISKERTILFKTPNYRIFFTVGLLTEERLFYDMTTVLTYASFWICPAFTIDDYSYFTGVALRNS